MKTILVALTLFLAPLCGQSDVALLMSGGRPLLLKVDGGQGVPIRTLHFAEGANISYSVACLAGECTLTIAAVAGAAEAGAHTAVFASAATSWTVPGATHALETCDLGYQVWSVSGDTRLAVEPGQVSCTTLAGANQYDVTVAFAIAQAGRLVLMRGGGGAGGGGDTTVVTNSGATGASVLKVGTNVVARKLKAGTGITITENADDIEVSATGGGGSGDITGVFAVSTLSSWGTLAAHSCQAKNIAVPGALAGDVVAVGWPPQIEVGLLGEARVPSADLVVLTMCNVTASGVAVADGQTWKVGVLRSAI